MSKGKVPSNPFQRIALSLSGGGYRAASFHLGSMSYLHRLKFKDKPLLEHVKTISTVSGGTITGVLYAMMVQQKKSFPEVYQRLIDLLSQYDLVEEALERLGSADNWPAHKRKNLINAFALRYDEVYTEGATFNIFDNMSNSHLEEVIFNATGFEKGLSFRFQNQGDMGNKEAEVPNSAKPEIKLGDIIAASSCFPGGFEPIAFPDDFMHGDAKGLEALKQHPNFDRAIGLMDGGIYDNQGIDSILKSSDRYRRKQKIKEPAYDLMIISDVTSPYMKHFKFTPESKEGDWKAISFQKIKQEVNKKYRIVQLAVFVLLFLSIFSLAMGKLGDNWMTGAGIVLLMVSLASALILRWGKKRFLFYREKLGEMASNQLGPFFRDRLGKLDFTKYSLRQLEPLIFDRLWSVFTMVNDVFLKQVRRLNYKRIYENPEWTHRRISNLIRELTPQDFPKKMNQNRWLTEAEDPEDFSVDEVSGKGDKERTLQEEIELRLGKEIPAVATNACEFGTTLWFTPKDQLEGKLNDLLATGQFTMCYNIYTYLYQIKHWKSSGYDDLSEEGKNAIEVLEKSVRADWKKFKEDPYFMVKEGIK